MDMDEVDRDVRTAERVTDEEIETVWTGGDPGKVVARVDDPRDADGTDTDGTDGTDGDGTDGTDGTDGDAGDTDGTDGGATDADSKDA
ncbi:MAG TPA: hypothetical protein VEP73_12155 [Actinomycetota bacterium]|nr:hypothetical protein [Actinomycetota bacterium]